MRNGSRIAALLAVLSLSLESLPLEAQVLTHVDAYFDGDFQDPLTIDGLDFVFATTVSPGGEHVYSCGGNGGVGASDNALAVFSRDASTGELTFVEAEFDDDDSNDPGSANGLFPCRDVLVSPDGKHVYTAGFGNDEIGIFTRNSMTGELTFNSVVTDGSPNGLAGVEGLAITSDGSALFAVGSIDDALVAFTRNSMTGALTFADSEFDGVGVDNSLDRPIDVTVSPTNDHIYVAAGGNANFTGSDAVSAFSWNGAALTYVDSYFEGASQGMNTIDGLHRLSSVVASPDGKHVYATGGLKVTSPQDPDWIGIFSRDLGTGALTWVDSIDDFNFCDLDILFEFETYAVVSPDSRVYVTSSRTALAVFERDTTTGLLSFVNGRCLFDDLSLGINLPKKLAIETGDSRHVYVPGTADDAVSAFRVCNPVLDGENVVLPDQDVTTMVTEIACESLAANDYDILAGGDVVFTAPAVVLGNGFEAGLLTIVNP